MKVRWLRRAEKSLEAIADYIALDNPPAAYEMIVRLRAATSALAKMPDMGRPGRVKRTRELVVPGTPYIVAYRTTDDAVEILHVLHTARRWPRSR
jgi:toxin ParE1/3/4